MGRHLTSLYIEHCHRLTNPTLITIAECCTSLRTLNISETGITADAVITYLIKPNRLLELASLEVGEGLLPYLRDFVMEEENGANGRWQDVLQEL